MYGFWLKSFRESLCWTALTRTGFWPGLRTHKKHMYIVTARIQNHCPVSSLAQCLKLLFAKVSSKRKEKKKSCSQNLLLKKSLSARIPVPTNYIFVQRYTAELRHQIHYFEIANSTESHVHFLTEIRPVRNSSDDVFEAFSPSF